MPNSMPGQPRLVTVICTLVVLFIMLGGSVAQTAKSSGPPVYLDPAQPVNVRVDDLVSRMTLEEKASQLVNQSRAIPRLKVPEYDWWSEALHGVARAGTATVFPGTDRPGRHLRRAPDSPDGDCHWPGSPGQA